MDEVYLLVAPLLLSCFDFCCDLLAFCVFVRIVRRRHFTGIEVNLAALIVLCDDYSHSSVCLSLAVVCFFLPRFQYRN